MITHRTQENFISLNITVYYTGFTLTIATLKRCIQQRIEGGHRAAMPSLSVPSFQHFDVSPNPDAPQTLSLWFFMAFPLSHWPLVIELHL